jgi:hypothetical protein
MKFKASKKQIEQLKKFLKQHGKNAEPTKKRIRDHRDATPSNQ